MPNWIRNLFGKFFSSRMYIVSVFFVTLFTIVVARVFVLQIIKGSKYQKNFKLQIQKVKEIKATRGNIYDRNGELLAYDDLAYSVTIEDDGSYDDLTNDGKNLKLNEQIKKIIDIIELNNDSIVDGFGIKLDSDGNYKFTAESNYDKVRFLADIYGHADIKKLTSTEKNSSPDDVMKYLMSRDRYYIKKSYGKENALKIAYIRFLMTTKSYTKYLASTIAMDVSKETVATINEYKMDFPGINIAEESVRRYDDGECFAPIIGYTGVIDKDEYKSLSKKEKKKYSLTSVVGKAGLEQRMDDILQGHNGKETLFVDSVGKVISVTDKKDPEAGNDLHLTIDKKIQKQAYQVLERELAGIVLRHITDKMTFDKSEISDTMEINIPVGDVYGAFFTNGIIDTEKFDKAGEDTVAKRVYKKYKEKEPEVIKSIVNEINTPTSEREKYSQELEDYIKFYLKTFLTNEGILLEDKIDEKDEKYKAWKDGKMTLKDYLGYAFSRGWIDTSVFCDGQEFSDSEQMRKKLGEYSEKNLMGSHGLSLLGYKYLIIKGDITGCDTCAIAIEQGVFTEKDGAIYESLKNNSHDACQYVKQKIDRLELTPGELGLEPCSASCIITDPNNGDVLACVSYPGYDNNRLSNDMDTDYYKQLSLSYSKPLYNHATQEKTAPGSTYKMVTSLAGLESGIITTDTKFECTGVFDLVEPPPKCWSYPYAHGKLDVVGAISNSCNCFYYNVGYNMSMTQDKNYSSLQGTDILKKYSTEFGLNEKSGLELEEAKPEISDEDSVRSAIGQGNHNFTTSQLAVYLSAVVNKGTVYNLSLIDKVTDKRKKTVKKYGSTVRHKINAKENTWNAIHRGMNDMVKNDMNFNGIYTDAGGKTGTAQESGLHPDNVLFLGYAPYKNPKYAIATRITNGYTSAYTAQIGCKVLQLCTGATEEEEIIGDTAYSVIIGGATD